MSHTGCRHFEEILKDLSYKDWAFCVFQDAEKFYLQLQWVGPCSETGQIKSHSTRKWYLSPWMTRSEVIQTALKAVLTAEEHEAREQFLYKGKAIFGPHLNVDVLYDVYGKEVLDARR